MASEHKLSFITLRSLPNGGWKTTLRFKFESQATTVRKTGHSHEGVCEHCEKEVIIQTHACGEYVLTWNL